MNAELHQSEVNCAVELAEDQDSLSSRYPADGLLSEQCVWHSFYAPVDPLLGSGSDTALPCCETLTTLILKLTKNLLQQATEENTGRKDERGEVGAEGGVQDWDLCPADTFEGESILALY